MTGGSTCRSRSSVARACSPRRCRRRCSTAGPTRRSTRPRICPRSPSTASRSPRCPSGGRCATPWWARRSPRCPKGRPWPPARGAGGCSWPNRGRTSASPSCGATCAPAWRRPPSSTPSSSPRSRSSGWAWATTSRRCCRRAPWCRRWARAPSRSSAVPATSTRRLVSRPSSTGSAAGGSTPSGRSWPSWAATATSLPAPTPPSSPTGSCGSPRCWPPTDGTVHRHAADGDDPVALGTEVARTLRAAPPPHRFCVRSWSPWQPEPTQNRRRAVAAAVVGGRPLDRSWSAPSGG